jgi:hypothetical protein
VLAALTSFGSVATASPVTVYSNNPAPGDVFTHAGYPGQGQAVGTTGWYYNFVLNGGKVGIRTDFPRNGNGSVWFQSPDINAQALFEYLADAVYDGGAYRETGSLGKFGDLSTFGYEWYRVGTSTNPNVQEPDMYVLLDADGNLDTTDDRGGLVYGHVYNGEPGWTTPTDTWVRETITSLTYLWNFGLGLSFLTDLDGNGYAFDTPLKVWQSRFPEAIIMGFGIIVGGGWDGFFTGAVDNITWTIGNQTWRFNFEVPEPASLAPLAAGLLGLGFARRGATGCDGGPGHCRNS